MFGKNVGKWLDPTGPDADIVLSSRVRFARNIHNVVFPGRCSPEESEAQFDPDDDDDTSEN